MAYPHLYISCKQTTRLQLANQSDKQTKAVRTTLPACQLQTVAHTHATYTHMNTRSYIAHTPIYTHTRIHTIIWHMPLQNIDSSANRKREREKNENCRGGKLLAERTSCFKSQGTYLPPPSHTRGTYLTLSVHLHLHLCLQAFNISY